MWRRKVYTDEVRVQIGAGTGERRRVRRRPGREAAFEERYLQPAFVGEPLGVWFWAAITYGKYSALVPLRERTEGERTSEKD
jgi:hypothetical protein